MQHYLSMPRPNHMIDDMGGPAVTAILSRMSPADSSVTEPFVASQAFHHGRRGMDAAVGTCVFGKLGCHRKFIPVIIGKVSRVGEVVQYVQVVEGDCFFLLRSAPVWSFAV